MLFFEQAAFRVLSELPDLARRFFGERAQDHLTHASPPKLVRDRRGVGHTPARFDVGQERRSAATFGCGPQSGEQRQGEGPGVDGVAKTCAGELGEDLRTMNVFFVHRFAQGADASYGDHERGSLGEEGLVGRCAF